MSKTTTAMLAAIILLLALERAYSIGFTNGRQSAPEWAEAKAEIAQRAYASEIAALNDETDRDRACAQIIDTVEELLDNEAFLFQEAQQADR